jgi:hypothetical protein
LFQAYIVVLAVITLVTAFYMKETAGRDLKS